MEVASFTLDPGGSLAKQLRSVGMLAPAPIGREYLYRFVDSEGTDLYVGITRWLETRWGCHKRAAEWWPRVASAHVQEYAHGEAIVHELAQIKSRHPAFNKRGVSVNVARLIDAPFTESGTSRSLGEWKGREWKRKRSEIPRSGSSISSGSVTREPRLGMDGGKP